MTTLIAFAKLDFIHHFQRMPPDLIPTKLRQMPSGNERVKQRHRCRQLAHFLLWELCKKAEIPTALLSQILRTPSGRPEFPVENIDFNISHSGDWVAVVLNVAKKGKTAVGIDIEQVNKPRNYTALLSHFAAAEELDWFVQQADPEKAFYRIWCLREAVLKSQGVGIVALSEVVHLPVQAQLNSRHCPQGQAIFIETLPFYLAVFAAETALNQATFFHWNGQLNPVELKSAVKYQVNLED